MRNRAVPPIFFSRISRPYANASALLEEDVLRAPTNSGIVVRHGGVDVRLASTERFDDRMLAASAPDHQDLHDPMRRRWLSGFLVSRTRVEHLDHFGGCMSLRKFPSESSNVTTLPHG